MKTPDMDLSQYDTLPDNACLTLAELAKLIGKSQSMVRKLVAAKKIPEPHNANSGKPGHIVYSRSIVRHVWSLGILRKWRKSLSSDRNTP